MMKSIITFAILLLTAFIIISAANPCLSQNYDKLGVNLTSQGAFVNVMNHTSRFQDCDSFDDKGWPLSDFKLVLMDNRPVAEWGGAIDDPDTYRVDYSGKYKCSFRGEADVQVLWSSAYTENMVFDEETNISTFDLVIPGPPGDGHAFIYLDFTKTTRRVDGPTNTGLTELKFMRPGYDLNIEKVFTDEFISLCKAADFSCYRFYGLQNIWGGEPEYPEKSIWTKRKTPEDASQSPMTDLNGKRDGWCWEYIIELANILKKDIWINIHISCDTNYVLSLAQMLKNQLDPSIKIYVENSNEVWSPTHMTHGPYNQAQADEFGISFMQNYARRTIELSDLFAQVFGHNEINKRIRVILAGQHAFSGRHDYHLDYIVENIGPPKDYIYALSTALYFGSDIPDGSPTEINQGMISDIDRQINEPDDNTYRPVHIAKAEQYGLPGGCTSYEGGPHIPSGGTQDNLENQILAHRTPDMKDILIKNYAEAWFDIGGGLAMHFTLAGGYNRYGCWGLTDDYTNPDRNYKMQAMRELAGEWSGAAARSMLNEISLRSYPNPFRNATNIEFELPAPAWVTIRLFDQLGEEVKCILGRPFKAGSHNIRFDASGLAPGLYFYSVETDRAIFSGKCLLVR